MHLGPVGKPEWLLTVFAFARTRILARAALSAGGIRLPLFLDDAPFQGRRSDGKALADRLVMHGSLPTALKATVLLRMVQPRPPGSPFAGRAHDGAVAGGLDPEWATPMARCLAATGRCR